jgi:pyrimidine and pyridine-specific 5'-nucleotidase
MTQRIREYIIGLGLEQSEAERLHHKYYKEYGLAIRGLVMHHKIDALDYDSKCDATLPLEDVLKPDEQVKRMLKDLDRSKCRVWALTNAYKTVREHSCE